MLKSLLRWSVASFHRLFLLVVLSGMGVASQGDGPKKPPLRIVRPCEGPLEQKVGTPWSAEYIWIAARDGSFQNQLDYAAGYLEGTTRLVNHYWDRDFQPLLGRKVLLDLSPEGELGTDVVSGTIQVVSEPWLLDLTSSKSVKRNLVEIKLARMSDDDLSKIFLLIDDLLVSWHTKKIVYVRSGQYKRPLITDVEDLSAWPDPSTRAEFRAMADALVYGGEGLVLSVYADRSSTIRFVDPAPERLRRIAFRGSLDFMAALLFFGRLSLEPPPRRIPLRPMRR